MAAARSVARYLVDRSLSMLAGLRLLRPTSPRHLDLTPCSRIGNHFVATMLALVRRTAHEVR